ncbi:MAG: hypothetical protein GY868_10210 [Deltaproteobacteria bacterium]|nr:hypothetical protein [Deltaproteobacteria bacterium]
MKKVALYLFVGLALFGLPFIAYTSEEYRGANKCKVCHIKIYKSWKKTSHATAFEVLNPGVKAEAKKKAGLDPQKDYTTDASCVQCHTTGNSTMLPGIHCEACHGAGKKYSSAKIMNKKKWRTNPEQQLKLAVDAGLVVKPDESNCKSCHNDKSPTFSSFDYTKRYEEIKHTK